jgi:hypothetical protein
MLSPDRELVRSPEMTWNSFRVINVNLVGVFLTVRMRQRMIVIIAGHLPDFLHRLQERQGRSIIQPPRPCQ